MACNTRKKAIPHTLVPKLLSIPLFLNIDTKFTTESELSTEEMGIPMATDVTTSPREVHEKLEYKQPLEFDENDRTNVNQIFIRVVVSRGTIRPLNLMPLTAIIAELDGRMALGMYANAREEPTPDFVVKKITFDLQYLNMEPEMITAAHVFHVVRDILYEQARSGRTPNLTSLELTYEKPDGTWTFLKIE
ncbi:hypothetical protein P170DRAFT_472164 [Aspergillus steynii IBT 23096]|uniref:Uncharacterized protein n=1 Tax=Aspergillus steynii IBT 23096 TaxID=1392250 RepID=A0A2I2GHD9_9EURO|nr:uncharacterized protein P170DRAFT_472164 [Aspergillus steynii IBT 23096]PLB52257.1 hypothetical protein P170DRAFT_472164 [Aspergillus steynii IBT 23096]